MNAQRSIVRRGIQCLAALLLAVSLSPWAMADDKGSPDYWLQQLGPAMETTAYRGVFVYARGDQVRSMQIAHRYEDGQVEERLVLQDGETGEMVRKGMHVVCVLAGHGRLELPQTMSSGPLAKTLSDRFLPISRWYQPVLEGDDRIAGYDVVKLSMKARDEQRYSHQLWLEKESGLPVKGQVLSRNGEVLEYFHFTSLEIGGALPDQAFVMQSSEGLIEINMSDQPAASQPSTSDGWTLNWQPSGFESAVAKGPGADSSLAFSDGLASFSVFVEPAKTVEMPTGASAIGATTIFMKQLRTPASAFTVTVVGEIPLQTALRVAESVSIENPDAIGEPPS